MRMEFDADEMRRDAAELRAAIIKAFIEAPPGDPETCYIGMRHMAPDAVRNIRALLDLGETPAKIKSHFRDRPGGQHGIGCVDYMVANPLAGCVKWDGCRYSFKDHKETSP